MDWNNIKEGKPPKGVALFALCKDGKLRTIWRCNCKDNDCSIYRDSREGSQLSIEIIKWRLK